MDGFKKLIEALWSFIGIFSKEHNKVTVFFILVLASVFWGFFYYNNASEQAKNKMIQDIQAQYQESERKRIESDQMNQKQLIESKSLWVTSSISWSIEGSIGNNNIGVNQAGSGGINLANSSMENSTVNYVINNYTTLSKDEIQLAISKLTDKEAEQIFNKVKNTPQDTSTASGSSFTSLVSSIFEKFAFNNKGLDSVAWNVFSTAAKNGCNLDIIRTLPEFKDGKYYLNIDFYVQLPSWYNKCLYYVPSEIIGKLQWKWTLWSFELMKDSSILNFKWNWTSEVIETGMPISLSTTKGVVLKAKLEWKPLLGRDFNLTDVSKIIIHYEYDWCNSSSFSNCKSWNDGFWNKTKYSLDKLGWGISWTSISIEK